MIRAVPLQEKLLLVHLPLTRLQAVSVKNDVVWYRSNWFLAKPLGDQGKIVIGNGNNAQFLLIATNNFGSEVSALVSSKRTFSDWTYSLYVTNAVAVEVLRFGNAQVVEMF